MAKALVRTPFQGGPVRQIWLDLFEERPGPDPVAFVDLEAGGQVIERAGGEPGSAQVVDGLGQRGRRAAVGEQARQRPAQIDLVGKLFQPARQARERRVGTSRLQLEIGQGGDQARIARMERRAALEPSSDLVAIGRFSGRTGEFEQHIRRVGRELPGTVQVAGDAG